jgi:hypothetical protein
MTLQRRKFLQITAATAALPPVSRVAWAQAYPTKPVRMIVGYPPGGATDITARLIGQRLSERLGQPFRLGLQAAAKAPPDGYTLLVVDAAPAINATLYHNLNFVFLRDIAPVFWFRVIVLGLVEPRRNRSHAHRLGEKLRSSGAPFAWSNRGPCAPRCAIDRTNR